MNEREIYSNDYLNRDFFDPLAALIGIDATRTLFPIRERKQNPRIANSCRSSLVSGDYKAQIYDHFSLLILDQY